jgi:hypothetical protein
MGVADHGVRDTTHKSTTQTAETAAPDDYESGVQLLGQLQDLCVGTAHQ